MWRSWQQTFLFFVPEEKKNGDLLRLALLADTQNTAKVVDF